jgi:CBS domain-containing protein
MRPIEEMPTVEPDLPAIKAVELMSRGNLTQLLVMSGGDVKGVFSQRGVLRFLQIHSGIGAEPKDLAA